MYKDSGAEIINEKKRGELETVLLYGLRDKAFLHIIDPVLCTAKKMAAHLNSLISQQTGHSGE